MRQIKFRAWSITKNIMLYPTDELHITFNEGYWHLENCYDYEGYDIGSKCDGDKTDCILMQFTGLKDKNGKEIYEGDIVICDRHEDHIQWQIEIKDIRLLPDELRGSNLNWREVIGNIYENPKLLEAKK